MIVQRVLLPYFLATTVRVLFSRLPSSFLLFSKGHPMPQYVSSRIDIVLHTLLFLVIIGSQGQSDMHSTMRLDQFLVAAYGYSRGIQRLLLYPFRLGYKSYRHNKISHALLVEAPCELFRSWVDTYLMFSSDRYGF